jgi:hypothetical protein
VYVPVIEEKINQEDEEMGGTLASPRDFRSTGYLLKKRSRGISAELSPGLVDSDVADEDHYLLLLGSPLKRQKICLENQISSNSGLNSTFPTLNLSRENSYLINSGSKTNDLRKDPSERKELQLLMD